MSEFVWPNDPVLINFSDRDNDGVHFNSSIINHAFYLLTNGSSGISLQDAERIFYRALTTKLSVLSEFVDMRFAAIQSAVELFGENLSSESVRLINGNVELINKHIGEWIRNQKHIDSDIAQRVLDLLAITKRRRSLAQVKLKMTPKRRSRIEQLVRQGNRMPQFKGVIEFKIEEWWDTDWQKNLTPETLFGDKFQKYLEQKKKISWKIISKMS